MAGTKLDALRDQTPNQTHDIVVKKYGAGKNDITVYCQTHKYERPRLTGLDLTTVDGVATFIEKTYRGSIQLNSVNMGKTYETELARELKKRGITVDSPQE